MTKYTRPNVEKKPDNKRNDKNEKDKPKRSFNFYWIYGIIILVILSINLFQYNSGSTEEITNAQYREMLEAGDVQKIVVVNEQMVKVYLKEEALDKEPHATKVKRSPISGQNTFGKHC